MKVHEYNEMMAYLLRPRQKFANGGKVFFVSGFDEMNYKRRLDAFEKLKKEYGKKFIEDSFEKEYGISIEDIALKKEHNGRTVVNIIDGFKKKIKNVNRSPNTSPVYNEKTGHIYKTSNRFGTFYNTNPGKNQYDFDRDVIDKVREDSKTMAKKEILEKYKGQISRATLTRLGLKYGKTLESGRPRVTEGERSAKEVKRTNRIRNVQGFPVSGTAAKNFHHIFPIGGMADFSPQDVMILDKKYNEMLGGFNLRLNDIADEIGTMDLSDRDALKRLNDLNAESKEIVDRAKSKLPKNLKNAIGYIEYSPVFDENGTIFELQQIRKGVDKNPSALAKFGNKKFKNFSSQEKKDFKEEVNRVANMAERKGMMLAANPFLDPKAILTGLGDVARVLGTPSVAATFAGTTIKENLDKGDSFLDAATDKMVGIDLLYPELAKQTVGKLAPRGTGILSTLGRFAANPFGRAARAFTPIGAGITAIGLGKDYYDFVQSDLARKAADPEAYAAEQEEQMGMSA